MIAKRRRIWSEMAPYEAVRRSDVLRALAARSIELSLAVRPSTMAELPEVVQACAGHGVRLALWPMLRDEDGRWANTENAEAFRDFTLDVVSRLRRRGLRFAEVAVDLEPPIRAVKDVGKNLHGQGRMFAKVISGERLQRARSCFEGLVGRLHDEGIEVSAAVVPVVVLDGPHRPAWQAFLRTPVDGIDFDSVNAMAYTSMIEGWSKGLLERECTRALFSATCETMRKRFGDRAAVSLGAVGTGALGDEPVYRSTGELADDVAIACRTGIRDIALFDLGGVLRRPPLEAWLDALVATEPAAALPAQTVRSWIAGGALVALGVLLDRVMPKED